MQILVATHTKVKNPGTLDIAGHTLGAWAKDLVDSKDAIKKGLDTYALDQKSSGHKAAVGKFAPLGLKLANDLIKSKKDSNWPILSNSMGQKKLSIIPKDGENLADDLISKIDRESINIAKSIIRKAKIPHSSEHFSGIFQNSNHFKYLVNSLPSDDSKIYLSDIETINKHSIKKIHQAGIYFYHQGLLYKSGSFSKHVWEDLKVGILDVFSALNAKYIALKDESSTESALDVSISKQLRKFAPQIGLDLQRTESFELECELNGLCDTESAVSKMHLLDNCRPLQILAKNIIDTPNNVRSINQSIKLDISFGVSLSTLACMQGSYKHGHSRNLTCSIKF